MHPKLLAMDGPLKGRQFPLEEGEPEAAIGRDPGNRIHLPGDGSASRHHCRITRGTSGEYRLQDLNSRNGTFVNGVPVKDRVLAHGDIIHVGKSAFLFLISEDAVESGATSVRLERGTSDTSNARHLRRDQSVYLNPEKVLATPAFTGRLAQAFQAILQIGAAMYAARGCEALAHEVLQRLFDVIPAARGSVLIFERGGTEPVWDFSLERGCGSTQSATVPADLVVRVFQDGVAVLTSGGSLAAPLVGSEGVIGVLYLEADTSRVRFEDDHLQLATAIGVIAGATFENARRLEWLESENRRLREEIHIQHDMVGESAAMREVYHFIAKVAAADSTVLIMGESGTGKELVARAIHRNSARAAGPFLALNCAALTETLVESELFGHERGAFTGAIAQKRGKLEVAEKGTLFLDEIGELPLELQAKLLRFLQERNFERVGGTRTIAANVRVIAATNRDLRAGTAERTFRADLYYRLNVVSITMPALRERREDIPLLASYFASRFAKRSGRGPVEIGRETRRYLTDYAWPGNVRELENVLERAVVLGSGDIILPEDLPDDVIDAATAGETGEGYYAVVQSEKKQLICKAIQQAKGNYTEAARTLGIHANSLHRLIRKLGLREEIRKLLGH